MNAAMYHATQPMLHLRFEGRSTEVPLAALDLGLQDSDAQIKRAVAAHLGCDVRALHHYVIVRHHGSIVVRPEAIYG